MVDERFAEANFEEDVIHEYELPELDDELRLARIDELIARTGMSFNDAKDMLEAFDYDLVEVLAECDRQRAAKRAERLESVKAHYFNAKEKGADKLNEFRYNAQDKYYDVKDAAQDKYYDLKGAAGDKYYDIREKLSDTDCREVATDMVDAVKKGLSYPVDLSASQDGSREVPAGVLGAGLVAALYPLHKSKLVTAAGIGAIGAWAVSKAKNSERLMSELRAKVGDFSQNWSETMSGLSGDDDEDNCFTIPVEKVDGNN